MSTVSPELAKPCPVEEILPIVLQVCPQWAWRALPYQWPREDLSHGKKLFTWIFMWGFDPGSLKALMIEEEFYMSLVEGKTCVT